jgi:uncharacterized phage-like protein YoqJ
LSTQQESLFPKEPALVAPPRNAITITGSRQLRREVAVDTFSEHLGHRLGKDTIWMVGGARGLDQWAIEWLLQREQTCWVVVPFRGEDQPKALQHLLGKVDRLIELGLPRTKRAYLQRNEYMVDRSHTVFGFYVESKGGTFQTLQYALKSVTEVHAIPIGDL